MKSLLKRWAERALVISGAACIARRGVRQRSLVLAYHNIVPRGLTVHGDSSLHLLRDDFRRQLDALVQTHDVVPLRELFDASKITRKPPAVITFDDAYEGAITAGVDELLERGIPATIFVAPALLGRTTWWDQLADSKTGVVSHQERTRAIETLGGHSEVILKRVGSPGADPLLPRIGTESELRSIATKPGITLGSHSWSHPNLCRLSAIELEIELRRPLEWLVARHITTLPWLSYPYGLFNSAVEEAARKAGYEGTLRIDGGWVHRSRSSLFGIPRLNIPSGLSIDGFRLRLAGFGAAR
ncbi:MAG: polysaccharide deacetylase family protein [Gemmatimonadota bacterium]|nr:polysaccharide deacetylase family protein [Gemmatimonadota bacterium]